MRGSWWRRRFEPWEHSWLVLMPKSTPQERSTIWNHSSLCSVSHCGKMTMTSSSKRPSAKTFNVKLDKMKAEKEDLRLQLRTLSEPPWTTQADLEQQTSESKAEQQDLVFEKAQAQKLQKKLRMMEEALLKQKEEASHQAQREQYESETRKMASALKKAKSLLETERLRLQQEKSSLLPDMEKSKAPYVAQLDWQKLENITLVVALKQAEQPLENHHWVRRQSHPSSSSGKLQCFPATQNWGGWSALKKAEVLESLHLQQERERTCNNKLWEPLWSIGVWPAGPICLLGKTRLKSTLPHLFDWQVNSGQPRKETQKLLNAPSKANTSPTLCIVRIRYLDFHKKLIITFVHCHYFSSWLTVPEMKHNIIPCYTCRACQWP